MNQWGIRVDVSRLHVLHVQSRVTDNVSERAGPHYGLAWYGNILSKKSKPVRGVLRPELHL